MGNTDELTKFLQDWQADALGAKQVFLEYKDFLDQCPNVEYEFVPRPNVSYSLRARNINQKERNVFAIIDVIDDEPDNRWLSVCFYADMVTDPEEIGDFAPAGLYGQDALCFNMDEDDPHVKNYIFDRIREAEKKASE